MFGLSCNHRLLLVLKAFVQCFDGRLVLSICISNFLHEIAHLSLVTVAVTRMLARQGFLLKREGVHFSPTLLAILLQFLGQLFLFFQLVLGLALQAIEFINLSKQTLILRLKALTGLGVLSNLGVQLIGHCLHLLFVLLHRLIERSDFLLPFVQLYGQCLRLLG
jgi:hypothetical protein